MEFECPYMTQERLAELWTNIRKLKWRPSQVYERIADPRRDIGDMFYYATTDKNCSIPITSQVFNFDGGL
ncbi:MAG: hypothetical protein E7497_05660 [Ruminococcus sp.]|nr:hypothetical protein [Ruminococcus sp.]